MQDDFFEHVASGCDSFCGVIMPRLASIDSIVDLP
jgi:hypothetical protein